PPVGRQADVAAVGRVSSSAPIGWLSNGASDEKGPILALPVRVRMGIGSRPGAKRGGGRHIRRSSAATDRAGGIVYRGATPAIRTVGIGDRDVVAPVVLEHRRRLSREQAEPGEPTCAGFIP